MMKTMFNTFSRLRSFLSSNRKHISLLAFTAGFGYNALAGTPMIRLQMRGYAGTNDETVLYYQAGATPGFDASFDSYKLAGPNPAPLFSQQYGTAIMAINGVAPVQSSFTISLKASTPVSSSFTISASDFSDLPAGTCIALKDRFTGTVTDLKTGAYVFYLADTTLSARFVLSITSGKLPFGTHTSMPDCKNPNGGKIVAGGMSCGPFNYTWRDSSGAVIKSVSNPAGDSLLNLNGGYYRLRVTSLLNLCYQNDTVISVSKMYYPLVSFSAPDSVAAGTQLNYSPVNLSSRCQTYLWNFGDLSANSTSISPSHAYSLSGDYWVKLTGKSVSGCSDSLTKKVKVTDPKKGGKDITLTDKGGKKFSISNGKPNSTTIVSESYSVEVSSFSNGRTVHKSVVQDGGAGETSLDLSTIEDGLYVVTITSKGNTLYNGKKLLK
jgi:PKD repeat protein